MREFDIKEFNEKEEGIYVSIYMPTHKISSEADQDPIRLKNLLNKASESITSECELSSEDKDEFLKEGYKLLKDREFWNEGSYALFVLIDKDGLAYQRLDGGINEQVHVSKTPYLLPLFNGYERTRGYYILDISKDRFEVYSVSRDGIKDLETPRSERRFDELFDDKDVKDLDKNRTDGAATSFHGHDTKSEVVERETEKYFRYIADEMYNFFKAKGNPIILTGTTENVSEFKKYADGLNIVDTIEKPFDSIKKEEIMDVIKERLLPKYIKEIDEELEVLNTSIANSNGTDNLSRILQDAPSGRIEKLYIEKEMDNIHSDEMNKLVYDVLNGGGEIILIDKERNSFDSDVKAKYRY